MAKSRKSSKSSKSSKQSSKRSKKRSPSKAKATGRRGGSNAGSAKRSAPVEEKVNKSAAIRELLDTQPRLKPSLIASILQERGIDVTPQYVSMIKSQTKRRQGTSLRFDDGERISLRQLSEVQRLIEKVGGVDQMERIIQLIRDLESGNS